MTEPCETKNPFGTSITGDDIIETLTFFDSWEERYRYIIDLGRELPPMADNKKDETHLVRGCQSQVWIDNHEVNGRYWFEVDSDAFIVKGLLGVVLAVYNGRTAKEIAEFDIDGYFAALDLVKHLSLTRGNGLRSMVDRIRLTASGEQQ